MEILGLVELPTWLVVCLAFVFTIIIYTVYKRDVFRRLGITTKPSTFLIGDFGKLAREGMEMYGVETVKRYGKVFGTFWGNQPILVVADTDIIKQMLVKQFSSFTERFRMKSKPKGMNSAMSLAEGHHWRYLRTTLSPSFTTGKIRRMMTNINSCLDTLHNNIDDKSKENPGGFDLFPIFRAYTLDVILKVGFGVDADSQRNPDSPFVRNATEAFSFNFARNPIVILNVLLPDLPGLDRVEIQFIPKGPQKFFTEALTSLFEDRRKSDTDHADLLQTMINAHKEDDNGEISAFERKSQTIEEMKRKGLTDDEVIANSMVFMIAGYETTATTMAWLAYDIAVHTDWQDKLVEEIDRELGQEPPSYDSVSKMKYLDMVLNETLRIHPVATVVTRQAVEDTELCGVPVTKGMNVLIPVFALHFMEEYWDAPKEYKPERFAPENKDRLNEYAYVPFGQGPRNCIGMRLAQTEVKMTLVSLLQRYRIVRTDELMVPMEGTKKGFYAPGKPLLVKLEKRK